MSHIKQLFVSDTQIPYQDNRAVALVFQVAKAWKPDAIDILGDVDDQLEYSRFSDGTTDEFFNQLKNNVKVNAKNNEDYRKALEREAANPSGAQLVTPPPLPVDPIPFVKENAQAAKTFYEDWRKQHKKADIFAALGNHDIRIFDYMDKKAPEYLEYITPESMWGLENQGIEYIYYDEQPRLRYGGLYSHHGNTTSQSGLAVAKDILNMDISLVRGHSHNAGIVFRTLPLSGRQLVGMEIGHLCDEKAYGLKYTFNHTWEKGFAINHVIDGEPNLQFIKISPDYTCVVDGKVFHG